MSPPPATSNSITSRNLQTSRRRRQYMNAEEVDDQFTDFNDISIIDLFTPTKSLKTSPFVVQQVQNNHKTHHGKRKSGTGGTVLCLGLSTFFFIFIVICSFIFWIEPIILDKIQFPRFNFYFDK